ncbi:MAG: arginase family protein [Nannocystaceae bacterium]
MEPDTQSAPRLFGRACAPADAQLHLLAVPWDATSPRPGAGRAPAAIREASQRIETFDHQTGLPHLGALAMIDPPPALAELAAAARESATTIHAAVARGQTIDPADVELVERAASAVHEWVGRQSAATIAADKALAIVGGDHSAPLAAIEALARRVPGLGVLHLGGHADLRRPSGPFTRTSHSLIHDLAIACPGVSRIVQVGVRDLAADEAAMIRGSQGRILTFFDADLQERVLAGEPWRTIVASLLAPLPRHVHVSLTIDALTPEHGPQSARRAPGGLSWAHLLSLLAALVASGRTLLGFDLCEVTPARDPADTWDASVAARLLARLCALQLRSQHRI